MASALSRIARFFGSRRMAVTLAVGGTRIRRLVRILGIEAHYPKRNLSRPCRLQRRQTEPVPHGVGEFPSDHDAAEPIH